MFSNNYNYTQRFQINESEFVFNHSKNEFIWKGLPVAGFGSIASGGLFSYIKNSGLNFEGQNFSIVNNSTFDTTILNTLNITAQWNTNNAGNTIYSELFILNKIY